MGEERGEAVHVAGGQGNRESGGKIYIHVDGFRNQIW